MPVALTWPFVRCRHVFQTPIPARPACDEDMGVGPHVDRAIETSGRDDQQRPVHLHTRKRRSALRAETPLMPRGWDAICRNPVLARDPTDTRR